MKTIEEVSECRWCNGTGTELHEERESGVTYNTYRTKCTDCNGKKKIKTIYSVSDRRCKQCGGSGCNSCKNTGKEVSYERTEPYGGCFISTATTEFKGLPDDCYQLEVLRRFRDSYVTNLDDGEEKISLYYQKAPLIVEQIDKSKDKTHLLSDLYEMIQAAVSDIERNDNEAAYERYLASFNMLCDRFKI